ncbi:MAG: bifunctional serine/threonine-protein kinase/formylglycine-generating enzyme family protein [Waddliaceae bacterium]
MALIEEGTILGDYSIIKLIGQGALGSVYLAEHRFMKKPVAVKILPQDLTENRSFINRFEQEVAALANLNHPNIARIHNISHIDGHFFLVSDCVVDENGESTNLSQFLRTRERHLTEDEIYHFLNQIASALDYAHSQNGNKVVHRGLKLNNIMVSQGQLYLTDFGISRLVGAGVFLTRTFSAISQSLGLKEGYSEHSLDVKMMLPLHDTFLQSFSFLAPEQKRVQGNEDAGLKVDTWAFGVLACIFLTGDYPEGFFTMPSVSRKDLKGNWDNLLISCLQQDPSLRPDSLVAALKQVHTTQKPIPPTTVTQEVTEKALPPVSIGEKKLQPVIQTAQIERPVVDPDPAASIQVDSTVKYYQPEPREEKNVEPLLSEMVVIQGGQFYRGSVDGSRDEQPRHQITVPCFAIDVHPVTNEQFVRFLDAIGSEKDGNHLDLVRLRESRIKRMAGKFNIESGYMKHPVVGVTWHGAVAYARWIGKRLPTEAEWEVAARGGEESFIYPSGDNIEKSQANFFNSDTTAVMSYPANGVGLYDMAGNVYEWIMDWYGYNYYETSVQEPDSPKGPPQGVYRVLRGGCWKSLKEDLRCSGRFRNKPGIGNGTYGFRCATDVRELS